MWAARTELSARIEERTLRLDVRDERRGRRADGSGLLGLGDRLAVLDGRLEVQRAPGGDTRIAATIRCRRRGAAIAAADRLRTRRC